LSLDSASLRRLGISPAFRDAFGRDRAVAPAVLEAIAEIMGAPGEAALDPVRVARRGEPLPHGAELTLEDGTDLGRAALIPRDVPHGYHRLLTDAGEQLLIVGPGRSRPPASQRAWGWAVQLYATRSAASWGIGDLGDLRTLAEWSRREGAELLLVNPLNAPSPTLPQQPSPYFPSTRRFRNPLYLRIEAVPGAADALGDGLVGLATRARALNAERRIDRDAVWRLKLAALEAIWGAGGHRPGFDAYRAEGGRALEDWARYCVIAERHGPAWQRWPEPLRRPDAAGVGPLAAEAADRVAFHAWLQWLIDEPLTGAATAIGLVADMPIGVDPAGADAWAWQDQLAIGATIGAPPDRFNTRGQDWGLPPFIPYRLRVAGYRPFIETIRAILRHAAGLRIDHVMGLFRQWWIPSGSLAADGAYVPYPAHELLEIVAIESERAGAFVIGEDLGTVEPGVRETLAERNVLSCKLLWFEDDPPERWAEHALASVSTHDLPTIAGVWSGRDVADQERIGLTVDPNEMAGLLRHLEAASGLAPGAPLEEVIVAAHRRLGSAGSALVTATLDDALAVHERPNMPGTVDEWPNWSLALPVTLDALPAQPLATRVAAALREGRAAQEMARAAPVPRPQAGRGASGAVELGERRDERGVGGIAQDEAHELETGGSAQVPLDGD
jgi:4-alpha-glucanotransferase